MPATPLAGPMLAEVSVRFPSEAELDAVYGAFTPLQSAVEHLAISLGKLVGTVEVDAVEHEEPLTAETAWHLTEFARSIANIGADLRDEAARIDRAVRTIYLEQSR